MRRSPLIALLVALPILAFLAGCGTSEGDNADSGTKTSTTASADDKDTDDSTATTGGEDDDPGSGVTSAQLADILPTVDDVPAGYEVSSEDLDDKPDDSSDDGSDDGDDSMDQAILDACPEAEIIKELDNSSDDNDDQVSREFTNEANATLEVSLDPTPEGFDEETVGKVVDALSDCGTIKTEDEDGNPMEMELSAEESKGYGDFGVSLVMKISFSMMGTTIPLEFHGLIFNVEGTNVSVTASSGLDDATFEPTGADYDQLPTLANLMTERVGSL